MNNGAAIGYMILAAKTLRIPEKQIRDIELEMTYKMDERTEDEAEKEYQNF
jgi:hypothetical protein